MIDRLWVLWGEPTEVRTRRIIGELWRDATGYGFRYGHELQVARKSGFQLLPEFARGEEKEYRSRYLFATFSQRIPSPRRTDFVQCMESWGVARYDDPFEILGASGGVQMTDRIELAEFRDAQDDLARPLLFRVAGMRFYPGASSISQGDSLRLEREPANEHDSNATVLLVHSGDKLGHVPRQYAPLVASHLDAGHVLSAHAVRQLTAPADDGRWVVRLEQTGSG